MTKQAFHSGDLVRIAADLGPHMSHFAADADAIVLGSYADQYGGDDHASYSLHIKGRGHSSWYYENQLTLIERDRADLLDEWEAQREAEIRQKSDLNWIFDNGPEVAERPMGASLQALADSKGLGSLWGRHGEGLSWYENARRLLHEARPFLEKGDMQGWLAHIAAIQFVDYRIS